MNLLLLDLLQPLQYSEPSIYHRYTRSVNSEFNDNNGSIPSDHSTGKNSTLTAFCSSESIDSSLKTVALTVFFIAILISSVIGNSLVIAATCLSKQLRNRATVYFIVSLGKYIIFQEGIIFLIDLFNIVSNTVIHKTCSSTTTARKTTKYSTV